MRHSPLARLGRTLLLLAALGGASGCAATGGAPLESDLDRGVRLFRAGDYQGAIQALRRAIGEEAALADAYRYLVQSYLELGEWVSAFTAFTDAIAALPREEQQALLSRFVDALVAKALGLLEDGKVGDATTLLTQAARVAPESGELREAVSGAYLDLAEKLWSNGSVLEAIDAVRKALDMKPADGDARELLRRLLSA